MVISLKKLNDDVNVPVKLEYWAENYKLVRRLVTEINNGFSYLFFICISGIFVGFLNDFLYVVNGCLKLDLEMIFVSFGLCSLHAFHLWNFCDTADQIDKQVLAII